MNETDLYDRNVGSFCIARLCCKRATEAFENRRSACKKVPVRLFPHAYYFFRFFPIFSDFFSARSVVTF